jgi:hypothetical protein
MNGRQRGSGGVLRLRNLAMVENIRRAEDPAWRERLQQQGPGTTRTCLAGSKIPSSRCRTMPTRARRNGAGCPCIHAHRRAATCLVAERRSLGRVLTLPAPLAVPRRAKAYRHTRWRRAAPAVADERALHDAVLRLQKCEWVDRLDATVEPHILPTARVREACTVPGIFGAHRLSLSRQGGDEGGAACAH